MYFSAGVPHLLNDFKHFQVNIVFSIGEGILKTRIVSEVEILKTGLDLKQIFTDLVAFEVRIKFRIVVKKSF